jgi:hypothetical protein
LAQWEEIRHQVAIAGRVTDAQTGRAIGSAQVRITDAPLVFMEWLANRAKQYGDKWKIMMERPDWIRTAADGHFHFMDLPDGQYTLTASLPGSGTRYGTAQNVVTVTRDAEGNITMALANMDLPSTMLKGRITIQNTTDPVVMAGVRIQGTVERTFSDGDGQYLLAGLEIGQRTVVISAQGYQQISYTVQFSQAGEELISDFIMEPAIL